MFKKPLVLLQKIVRSAQWGSFIDRLRRLILIRRIDDTTRSVIGHIHHRITHTGRCLFCQEVTRTSLDLCRYCIESLPRNAPACTHCGQCLPVNARISEIQGEPVSGSPDDVLRCGACQKQPVVVRRAFAHSRYLWPADIMVRQLKYGKKLYYGRTMGLLMARELSHRAVLDVDVLIPIPLADSRWRERGFNQAEEIARTLARHTNKPLDRHLLIRHRQTGPQAGLSKKQRKRNIRGCFSCPATIAPQRYALIDDVLTTGATANEAARVLLAAGAQSVDIWVFARTP